MNRTLKIATWNLGYGIYPDHYSITGRQDSLRNAFPISKKEVMQNIVGQISILEQINADIMLLQEVSSHNPVNLWTNQVRALKKAYPNHYNTFIPSINIPRILVLGKYTLTKEQSISEAINTKFKALTMWDNLFMRNKVSILTRVKIYEKELVTINIHLAAFQRQSELREKQLRYIFDIALKEFEKDNYVVIGGDWNMDMPLTEFPSRYKSIKTEMPKDLIKKFEQLKWTLAMAKEATIRDLYAPYPDSEMNSIDGFLCSPNIEVLDIEAIQDFRFSDHCPVILRMKFK